MSLLSVISVVFVSVISVVYEEHEPAGVLEVSHHRVGAHAVSAAVPSGDGLRPDDAGAIPAGEHTQRADGASSAVGG